MNIEIVITGIIVAAAVIWTIRSVFKTVKVKDSSCGSSGCSCCGSSDSCDMSKIEEKLKSQAGSRK